MIAVMVTDPSLHETVNFFHDVFDTVARAEPFAPVVAPVEVETAFQLSQHITPPPVATSVAEKPKEKKAWIEIILVDMDGKPVPGIKYRITPPSGAPKEGRLNEHGQAGLYEIDPGNCKITFPDLDKEAWD